MNEENNIAAPTAESVDQQVEDVKGKGKAAATNEPKHIADDEDDDDEDEDDEQDGAHDEVEEPDEDNMEEIDEDNIIADGRRTRGKAIDFAKAAEGLDDEDEDEEDDGDFEDPDVMEE